MSNSSLLDSLKSHSFTQEIVPYLFFQTTINAPDIEYLSANLKCHYNVFRTSRYAMLGSILDS